MSKKRRSLGVRALNALCSIILLVSVIFALVAGFGTIVIGAMVAALVAAAVPVLASGEGVLEVLLGIVEAIFDGFLAIVEVITEFLSGIFG